MDDQFNRASLKASSKQKVGARSAVVVGRAVFVLHRRRVVAEALREVIELITDHAAALAAAGRLDAAQRAVTLDPADEEAAAALDVVVRREELGELERGVVCR